MELSAACLCGAPEESTEHYLVVCPDYTQERTDLLNKIGPGTHLTVDLILKGDQNSTDNYNIRVAKATQEYIIATKRFK